MSITVAIVGRPNAGKSSLFNRLAQERKSIVEETPGVTRDRIYTQITWQNKTFNLIDTGGFTNEDLPFQSEINMQVELAIDEADLIVFLADVNSSITSDDKVISKKLQRSNKNVILCLNKYDSIDKEELTYEWYSLGFETIVKVSTIHSIGIGDLLDEVVKEIKNDARTVDDSIKIAVVGKPNVGKSSFVNAVIGKERVIVSEVAGTTRDAIDIKFKRNKSEFTIIDTAGIRKRGKVYENIEKYSVMRAKMAIDKADVCLLMLDPHTGLTEQDERIVSNIVEIDKPKPIIIVSNKWDLYSKDTMTMKLEEDKIRNKFAFLSYAPIIFVSAKNNERIHLVFEKIEQIMDALKVEIKTGQLNKILQEIQILRSPPSFNGHALKLLYGVYENVVAPTFIIFVNNDKYAHFSYIRFIENQLRIVFPFEGIPIRISLRNKNEWDT